MKYRPQRRCTKRKVQWQGVVANDLSSCGDVSEQEQSPATTVRSRKGSKDARPSALRVLADASRVQAPAAVQNRTRRIAKTAGDAEDSGVTEAIAETLLKLSKDDNDT
jgi:hypothetical protein